MGLNTTQIFTVSPQIWQNSFRFSISWLVVLVTVSLTIINLLQKAYKARQDNNKSGIQFDKGSANIPSVSSLTALRILLQIGADFESFFGILIQRYGGIVWINMLGIYSFILVTDPSMLQKLYLSLEHGHLYKPKWYAKVLVGPLSNGLFGSSPNTWKIHRAAVSKTYTYKGLLRQLNIFDEHAKKFVLTLRDSYESSHSLDDSSMSFSKQVNMLTYSVILHVIAGHENHNTRPEEKARFHDNYNRVKEFISYRAHHPLYYMDLVWNLHPFKREFDKILEEMIQYEDKVITEIRKQFNANTESCSESEDDMGGKSLIQVLIKAGLKNNEIFAEIATVLVGGHESISHTLSILMFLLAHNKESQNKCRDEIDRMFDNMREYNSDDLSMEGLKSLTYLDMCIRETLRMYPIVPIFGRELESTLKIDNNIILPTGTIVFTSPTMIHRNPIIYPKPEKFIPERFSPDNIRKLGACEFMPFSAGPRMCIAYKSVMIELKVLAVHVLYNFEVHTKLTNDDLKHAVKKAIWPLPDLGIKVHPRH